MSQKQDSHKLLRTLSHIMDQKWLDLLIKSIEMPVIQGVYFPGFPPDQSQMSNVGSSGEPALRSAFSFYCEIKRHATNLGVELAPNTKVLDFGCGWGRIIRFFLKDVLADNLYGIDVDPEMIGLCQKFARCGNYAVCNPMPPTMFSDNTLP